ncbi:MAG: aldose 1-epimerase [Algibacter sp.]|uniref:aldose 1-epimerase n=1 Tax=Algibacter sp. TaxID=1872428 RepID=UPI002602CA95|nr:aldose 1-epimerase [Algibacter sp.]MDG1729931.1 aldose 1-epimerase [Algibacter sp.]MDG2178521.1 aldose 1-epimerase [Algibacter sp.]
MCNIKHIKDSTINLDYIEIEDSEKICYAKIHLNLGASLQELLLNKHHIIKDLSPLTYDSTYASSILFPFANRIEDGVYKFGGKDYLLDINQAQENNALHGFVYNKTFELVEKKATKEVASVLLQYEEKEHTQGFPYTYKIDLKYTLTKQSLDLSVSVKNTDTNKFPFTLGWHPYFNTSDLYNSIVRFKSHKQVYFDERNITQGLRDFEINDEFKVENKSLDDCFVLDSNKILFETPDYSFELTSSEKDCFLQLYTPPKSNTIAIEPTTGVSNSFSNKIGLKTLKPNGSYYINWKLKLN